MMKPLVASIWVLLAILGLASAKDSSWALTHVEIVDVVRGRVIREQTIAIRGDRIATVAATQSITFPDNVRTIDARGAYVIPGLYDMHAHAFLGDVPPSVELARRVREGVLGVRDMGASLDALRSLPRSPTPDWPLLPRIWYSGPILDGPRHLGLEDRRIVTDAAGARNAIDELTAAGAQFIKVHDFVSPTVYGEIVRYARAKDVPVVGHIPAGVSAEAAARAGQRSVEHLGGLTHAVLRSCSAAPSGGGAEFLRRAADDEVAAYRFVMSSAFIMPLVDAFDEERCAALAATFARARVWQVPTLVIFKSLREIDAEDPSFVVPPADRAARAALFRTQLRIVGIMHRAGVPVLPGLDGAPGVTIQDELGLLVDAGLTPAEALRSATADAADFLGVGDAHGRIAPGQAADLVLLGANPLASVVNAREIRAVVSRGQYLQVRPQ